MECKPVPTSCHFLRCVEKVAALYSAQVHPIWQWYRIF